MADRSLKELDEIDREAGRIYDRELKNKPLGDQKALLFDLMNKWYNQLEPAGDVEVDMMVGGTRVRAFGTAEKARKRWDEEHGKTNPITEKEMPAGISISTQVPEIWVHGLRKDARGNLVLPPHIMMHETEHDVKLKDRRFQDPHEGIKNETYKKPKDWVSAYE